MRTNVGPSPRLTPISLVRYWIEKGNLRQRDLIPEFGTESAVSMFLSGQGSLTVEQIQKLSARFKLTADVFIISTSTAAS